MLDMLLNECHGKHFVFQFTALLMILPRFQEI